MMPLVNQSAVGADGRPHALPVDTLRIAPELKAINRWVLWRYTLKRQRWAKIPYQVSGRAASSTDSATWASYDDASDALIMGGDDGQGFDGLGFVFTEDDDVSGLDIDDCRDPLTGALSDVAQEALDRIDGYAEVSPSGTGLKMFTRMALARAHKDDSKGIEMYKSGRYFTVTGHQLNGHGGLPLAVQDVGWFVEKHFGERAARETAATPTEAFEMYRPPLDGWALERVDQDLLAHLDPEMGYGPWVEVGMALHHQGRGDPAWLSLWDEWSAGSGKYSEGKCDDHWRSFSEQRYSGSGAKTLASLIWTVRQQNLNTAEANGQVVLNQKDFMANARELVDRVYTGPEGVVLRHSSNLFYKHATTHYAESEDNTVRSVLWDFLDRARATDRAGAVVPFRPGPAHISGVGDALRAITHLETVRPPMWLDACVGPEPQDVVSLRNGLFHIPTRALLPHTSKFFTLNTLPFVWEPDAVAPTWEKFLSDVWPDDREMIDTLQEMLGYLITADTSMQKMFMLIGPRRSGKGTIGRVINALIGKENITGPTLSSLTTNFGLQPLIGKLVAIVSDARAPGRDHQTIVERLLMMSGEDTITVDRKNLDAWVGALTARVVIMSNESLQLGDASGALVGRMVVLQMHKSFYGTEDTQLTSRLLKELPGIFNWALEGRARLYRRGFFVQPAGSAEAVDEMTKLNSPITEFLDKCCELGVQSTESKNMVFSAYKKWCAANDRHAANKVQFSKQLYATANTIVGVRPRTQDGGQARVYAGLRLKDAVRARVQESIFDEADDVFA